MEIQQRSLPFPRRDDGTPLFSISGNKCRNKLELEMAKNEFVTINRTRMNNVGDKSRGSEREGDD